MQWCKQRFRLERRRLLMYACVHARRQLRNSSEAVGVIQARRLQRSFGDGLIAAEVEDLREAWMPHVDAILADDEIIAAVHQALAQRHPNSRRRGRPGFSAEIVLRWLILKHLRNWSYQVLEREVRANLVYRDFTRVGSEKVPDAKTMGRWGTALGPAMVQQIHQRIVQIAQARKVVQGRKMRLDTTVVESNIHYPTDSSLLGDGVRVLIRTMKKISKLTGTVGSKLRDRSRSVKLRLLEIARSARGKTPPGREKMQRAYGKLLDATGRVVAGEAIRTGNHQRREAVYGDGEAGGAGGAAPATGDNGATVAAGHAPDQSADFPGRYP
jgi:transposase, IS5 family